MSVVANQDVTVQNWWHFFIQTASNVHGTCKLPVSHHRTISSSPLSWLSKNLSVALLEYNAFLKLDAFYEEFMFFLIFLLFNQQWGEFLCIIGLRNCVREYKTCHSPRSFDLCNETSVFCMDDIFELLGKLNVQGVRLIPVGFQTKLITFFDIAIVWKRKRRNEGGSRLNFSKIFQIYQC